MKRLYITKVLMGDRQLVESESYISNGHWLISKKYVKNLLLILEEWKNRKRDMTDAQILESIRVLNPEKKLDLAFEDIEILLKRNGNYIKVYQDQVGNVLAFQERIIRGLKLAGSLFFAEEPFQEDRPVTNEDRTIALMPYRINVGDLERNLGRAIDGIKHSRFARRGVEII